MNYNPQGKSPSPFLVSPLGSRASLSPDREAPDEAQTKKYSKSYIFLLKIANFSLLLC